MQFQIIMAMSRVTALERVPPVFERPYGDEDELAINPDRPCQLKAVVIGSVHPTLATIVTRREQKILTA